MTSKVIVLTTQNRDFLDNPDYNDNRIKTCIFDGNEWSIPKITNINRPFYTAVKNINNHIVIIGGYGQRISYQRCEYLNPQTSEIISGFNFQPLLPGEMSDKISVSLRNGTILIIDTNDKPWVIIHRPGYIRILPYIHCKLFNPTATLLTDGKVLIIGGGVLFRGKTVSIRDCVLYDSLTNLITFVQPIPQERHHHSAILMKDGRVLITGGIIGNITLPQSNVLKTSLIYNPINDIWSYVAPMLEERFAHSMSLLNDGRIVVTGGHNKFVNSDTNTCEIYDPSGNTWTRGPDIPITCSDHYSFSID
jgi:hypothetical protein